MLITDKLQLEKYDEKYRIWQGIPGIEVTKKGRIFTTFYSGGTEEQIGNYVLLYKSDDGEHFGKPIAVAYKEHGRCFDPCLWIDPLGRLWFTWACDCDYGVYATICNDPDADELAWSKPVAIGNNVMMNKPTVLSTGEWMFPIAVWKKNMIFWNTDNRFAGKETEIGSFVYKSVDNGKSFVKYGRADVDQRAFDEHMVLELSDGTLAMYVRTYYGIGVSYSYDSGKTWTEGKDSGLGGPCSRFFIRRLKSGRVLLLNNHNTKTRNKLTALLSEDDGKTFPYALEFDPRDQVSYPDAVETDDGYIYIVYDRERGAFLNSLNQAYSQAREICMARITEEDILKGKITDSGSYTGKIVSKLGKYEGREDAYFKTREQHAKRLCGRSAEDILAGLFDAYNINCMNLHKLDRHRLDDLVDRLTKKPNDSYSIIQEIIELLCSVENTECNVSPVIKRVKSYISDHLSSEISVRDIAESLDISMYYLCHLFKNETGISIKQYEKHLRLVKAKSALLNTDKSITEIAASCGYENSSYFGKVFMQSEGMSPGKYRSFLKNSEPLDKNVAFYGMIEHMSLLESPEVLSRQGESKAETTIITMPAEGCMFLHEAAIIEYKGILFAAWYNNKMNELMGETPIRYSRSYDCGKTWEEPKTLVTDPSGKIIYCPPVFGIDNGKLYMLVNQMVAPDHIHALDLYVYTEDGAFALLWSRPVPFKLNTNVYTLPNGKKMIAGRIAELDKFPVTPAVLVSDSGAIDGEWRVVKLQESGTLPDGSVFVHPETSLVVMHSDIYAFCRNDCHAVPLLYVSHDLGESWSEPISHDIPFSASKIYSGTLSDGRNYVCGNMEPDRRKLCLFISKPNTMTFDTCITLQDGYSTAFGFGNAWHYPCAYEYQNHLYVIYTVNLQEGWSNRGAVVSRIAL